MVFSTGYDMENEFKFSDGLGKLYTGFATAWSVVLISGCLYLIRHRQLSFLKFRNVPLAISAVATLHVYWVLCFFAYGLNGYFPCATEYWIMNIYLPVGIALFHLSNTKLLHVAVLQRRFIKTASLSAERQSLVDHNNIWKEHARKIKTVGTYKKTKCAVVIGLTVQLICSLIIFFLSRKFHSGFGLIGSAIPESPLTKVECRKGWEWLPSIFWQLFWSWIYAPYLLWKVKDIRDTHGWRTQTLICCLAGLPASPMWLLALYLPQMSASTTYVIPPLWFAPSILLIEIFMIFLPCWHIIKHHRLKKETLEIITQWENQKGVSSNGSECSSIPQSPQRISEKSSSLSSKSARKACAHMYTMAALEKALQTNSTPLLLFAALKDFSGENIGFLNHVREWNRAWAEHPSSLHPTGSQADKNYLRLQQFIKAMKIYSSFVSLKYSNFPINISHSHLKALEAEFEGPAAIANTDQENYNSAAPFNDFDGPLQDLESARGRDALSMVSTANETASTLTEGEMKDTTKQSTVIGVYKVKELDYKLSQNLSIPDSFGPGVFDNAAESVKYMVLTNTWPKFVDAGYAANMDKGTTLEKFQEKLTGCGIGRSRNCSF